MHDNYSIKDKKVLKAIEESLLATYFKIYDQEFLATKIGRQDIEANVINRYNSALRHVVPWVANQIDLAGKTLVEVGCGTGSSTAAFSHFVEKIYGYDVDESAVDGARCRLEILNIDNAELFTVKAEELIDTLLEKHGDGVDIILLFSVLEHQTVQERHETLRGCWQLLNEGGLLVVVETPNLLIYHDHHTSLLPFMQMLPTKLYTRYSVLSPRDGYNYFFKDYDSVGGEEAELRISRWGRGVSYHDFELTLGKAYKDHLVASGFEKEMLDWFNTSMEEELLRLFIKKNNIDIPMGFTRGVLNLIFRKGQDNPRLVEEVPGHIHFVPFQVLWREIEKYEYYYDLATENGKQLTDILNSRRWKLINVLSAPYRRLKNIIMGNHS